VEAAERSPNGQGRTERKLLGVLEVYPGIQPPGSGYLDLDLGVLGKLDEGAPSGHQGIWITGGAKNLGGGKGSSNGTWIWGFSKEPILQWGGMYLSP